MHGTNGATGDDGRDGAIYREGTYITHDGGNDGAYGLHTTTRKFITRWHVITSTRWYGTSSYTIQKTSIIHASTSRKFI